MARAKKAYSKRNKNDGASEFTIYVDGTLTCGIGGLGKHFPKPREAVGGLGRLLPELREGVGDLGRRFPDLREAVRGLGRHFPKPREAVGGLGRLLPDLREAVSGLGKHFPDLREAVRGLGKHFPDLRGRFKCRLKSFPKPFGHIKCHLKAYFLDNMHAMVYNMLVYKILQTKTYRKWFKKLRDNIARQNITFRIDRMREGNFGDSKAVGDGVFELRINIGKGYRVYFTNNGKEIVILLVGGDKSTQDSDIKAAKKMAKEF